MEFLGALIAEYLSDRRRRILRSFRGCPAIAVARSVPGRDRRLAAGGKLCAGVILLPLPQQCR